MAWPSSTPCPPHPRAQGQSPPTVPGKLIISLHPRTPANYLVQARGSYLSGSSPSSRPCAPGPGHGQRTRPAEPSGLRLLFLGLASCEVHPLTCVSTLPPRRSTPPSVFPPLPGQGAGDPGHRTQRETRVLEEVSSSWMRTIPALANAGLAGQAANGRACFCSLAVSVFKRK